MTARGVVTRYVLERRIFHGLEAEQWIVDGFQRKTLRQAMQDLREARKDLPGRCWRIVRLRSSRGR